MIGRGVKPKASGCARASQTNISNPCKTRCGKEGNVPNVCMHARAKVKQATEVTLVFTNFGDFPSKKSASTKQNNPSHFLVQGGSRDKAERSCVWRVSLAIFPGRILAQRGPCHRRCRCGCLRSSRGVVWTDSDDD